MIDEKELSDISAVIELTKWVKDGNVIPYFLWCLRDFVLDYKQYNSPDDYLEGIISTKDLDASTEKYRIRKNFGEFFKDRGCMFFVRPVNDEERLRKIETLEFSELRPEFVKSVDEFKACVSHYLKPKRYNNRILNGSAFIRLIEEILTAFNDHKVPEISSTVERVVEAERREATDRLKAEISKFVQEQIDDPDIQRKGVSFIWESLVGQAGRRQDPELATNSFSDLLRHFYQRLDLERGGRTQKALKDLEGELNDLLTSLDFRFEDLFEQLKAKWADRKLFDREFPGRFILEKLLGKKVYLTLFVKVVEDWRNRERDLDDIGIHE